jgi:hypothetical protein
VGEKELGQTSCCWATRRINKKRKREGKGKERVGRLRIRPKRVFEIEIPLDFSNPFTICIVI